MTLNQAQAILEVCFKRHHRVWMHYQRASSIPSETDVIKILTNPNYVDNLKTKEGQAFASIEYWEDRIKNNEYKSLPWDAVGTQTWSNKKYFKLGDLV